MSTSRIKTYRKTAPIDAILWDGSFLATSDIQNWALEYGVAIHFTKEDKLSIPTLEGTMFASVGDYIAKGVNNEFWPIKPDIMSKTYEEVV